MHHWAQAGRSTEALVVDKDALRFGKTRLWCAEATTAIPCPEAGNDLHTSQRKSWQWDHQGFVFSACRFVVW